MRVGFHPAGSQAVSELGTRPGEVHVSPGSLDGLGRGEIFSRALSCDPLRDSAEKRQLARSGLAWAAEAQGVGEQQSAGGWGSWNPSSQTKK